jgi:hypothetical protein
MRRAVELKNDLRAGNCEVGEECPELARLFRRISEEEKFFNSNPS